MAVHFALTSLTFTHSGIWASSAEISDENLIHENDAEIPRNIIAIEDNINDTFSHTPKIPEIDIPFEEIDESEKEGKEIILSQNDSLEEENDDLSAGVFPSVKFDILHVSQKNYEDLLEELDAAEDLTQFQRIIASQNDEMTSEILKNVCAHRQLSSKEQVIIFVDIDDTLIEASSDIDSFSANGDFSTIKVIAPKLIGTLRAISLKSGGKVSSVGLTSAAMWGPAFKKQTNQVKLVPLIYQQKQKSHENHEESVSKAKYFSLPAARAQAMKHLDLPFSQLIGPGVEILSFSAADSTPPNVDTLEPISIVYPSQVPLPSDLSTFFISKKNPIVSFAHNKKPKLYIKNQDKFSKITATPVYENGVIFSNFFNMDLAWQKGIPMKIFLFDVFGGDLAGWPDIFIIAIDDNIQMLENMGSHCRGLNVPFLGIHATPPPPPPEKIFWIFPPKKTQTK